MYFSAYHLILALQAISTHFASSECNYIDVERTSQESFSNEVAEIVKKRLGLPMEQKISLKVCVYSSLCWMFSVWMCEQSIWEGSHSVDYLWVCVSNAKCWGYLSTSDM